MIKHNILIILVLSGSIATAIGQEVQVPIDEAGTIAYIDSKLEQKLNLFPDYPNFKEARLFQVSDTLIVLEVYYQPQDRLLKKRLQLSSEEVRQFQQRVTQQIKQKAPQVAFDQTGRTRLSIANMALSLGYYGWALPVALGVDDGKLAVALYMLTSSAGFYLPFSLTKHMPVTKAAANMSFYGGTRGIAHGITLAYLFSNEPSEKAIIGTGMLISVLEAISGFVIASNTNMTAGTAEVIGVGGDFGIGFGLGAAHIGNLFEKNDEQSAAAVTLLGSGIGFLGGKLLADRQHYTRGDAYVLSAVGLLGAYIPLALVDIATPDKHRAYSAVSMLGAVLGLGLGHKLVLGKDFTTDQGNLIRLSELAGGLLGLGIAYLVSSQDADNSALYLTASAIGATGGFWLMYRSFAGRAGGSQNTLLGSIKVMPEGLLALAMGDKLSSIQTPKPLLSFTYRF